MFGASVDWKEPVEQRLPRPRRAIKPKGLGGARPVHVCPALRAQHENAIGLWLPCAANTLLIYVSLQLGQRTFEFHFHIYAPCITAQDARVQGIYSFEFGPDRSAQGAIGVDKKVSCPCGHKARLEPLALLKRATERHRSAQLADLHKMLKCRACGGKEFQVEHCLAPEAWSG